MNVEMYILILVSSSTSFRVIAKQLSMHDSGIFFKKIIKHA